MGEVGPVPHVQVGRESLRLELFALPTRSASV